MVLLGWNSRALSFLGLSGKQNNLPKLLKMPLWWNHSYFSFSYFWGRGLYPWWQWREVSESSSTALNFPLLHCFLATPGHAGIMAGGAACRLYLNYNRFHNIGISRVYVTGVHALYFKVFDRFGQVWLRIKDSSHEQCEEVYVSCLTVLYIPYLLIPLSGLRMWCSARWLCQNTQGVSSCAPKSLRRFYAQWRVFSLDSFLSAGLIYFPPGTEIMKTVTSRDVKMYVETETRPLELIHFQFKWSQRAARWRIPLRLDWRNMDVFSPLLG